MDFYNFRKIWNPDWFQGNQKKRNYFEGWYFKLVNPYKTATWAVIPGISHGSNEKESYPFIQLINGKTGDTHFIKYKMEDFNFSRKGFEISIAGNHFSNNGITLNISEDNIRVSGKISFLNPVKYPVKLFSPGVMGWYRFIPTMECYHGIMSMLHSLEGSISISGTKVDFSGGKGYIEKDWGKSMPLAWIWMQSNHFTREDLSISFSIAHIPWKRSAFTGFLIILSLGNEFYRFTTYNGSKITKLLSSDGKVVFKVENRHYSLTVNAESQTTGDLKAPVSGEMRRTIHESIGASVNIQLASREGSIILEDRGQPAGMEIAGDVRVLQKEIK